MLGFIFGFFVGIATALTACSLLWSGRKPLIVNRYIIRDSYGIDVPCTEREYAWTRGARVNDLYEMD